MANITNSPAKDRAEARPEATRGGVFFTPRVDIVETDAELTLFAEVPGVRPEDVELRYEKGELLLHGRVRPRHQQRPMLLQEYDEGDFYRAFTIHESINAEPHLGGVQERRADCASAEGRGGSSAPNPGSRRVRDSRQ